MATMYSETPHNWKDISPNVICDTHIIVNEIITADRILFYDTCSFRYHANLNDQNKNQLISYFLQTNTVVLLTRIIIMELGSRSGVFENCYINYIRTLKDAGIKILILDEELLYNILSVCFSTNEAVNGYLLWAVRSLRAPVSTITETLNKDASLDHEVRKGRKQTSSNIYSHFFRTVTNNKKQSDNLGEEMLAICLHILSHLPGTKDGKLCVATEDKGGAGKINSLMQGTNQQYRGAKIIIYSTPKLVQAMMDCGILQSKKDIETFLKVEDPSNIGIIGITEYDLEAGQQLSMPRQDLVDMLLNPGSIRILF